VSEQHGAVGAIRFDAEAAFSQFVGFVPAVSLCADVKAHFQHGGLFADSRRNPIKRGFGFGKIAKFKPPLGFVVVVLVVQFHCRYPAPPWRGRNGKRLLECAIAYLRATLPEN
jgi:hypothetical protein